MLRCSCVCYRLNLVLTKLNTSLHQITFSQLRHLLKMSTTASCVNGSLSELFCLTALSGRNTGRDTSTPNLDTTIYYHSFDSSFDHSFLTLIFCYISYSYLSISTNMTMEAVELKKRSLFQLISS